MTVDDSRSSLSQLRPDSVSKFQMPSPIETRRHRFMLVTPSPCSISNTSSMICCRSAISSVSSPNEPKSSVFPPNAFQMLNTWKGTINLIIITINLTIKVLKGECAFTDRWSLDELAYEVPSDGPYQTNPPFPDDIILSIRIDREGQVCRIRHEEEIDVQEYQVLTHEIEPALKPLEEIIRENVFCLGERKPRKDRDTGRGRHSTFNEPSSSHLNDDDDDDDDDGNNEGTSCASTLPPFVMSIR
nr:cytochrome P450 [Tanacetum cinerariifolium]